MLNTIQKKISQVQSEFAYRLALIKHTRNLPALAPGDQHIVDALKSEGVFVTSLGDLGLTSTSQLLNAAKSQLSSMATAVSTNYAGDRYVDRSTVQARPQIYTVTDLPEFFIWGLEERLLNIVENYIGLPIAFQGVHLRKDFANGTQIGTQLWHKDGEDRRILKVLVYLNDVSENHGPFEYIPKSITSSVLLSWRIYYKILRTGFLGISDEEIQKIVPQSAWKSCPGSAGTVIFVDTQSVFHHGTLRKAERSTLFFVYTARHPKRPDLCTQYSDQTFARPELKVGS